MNKDSDDEEDDDENDCIEGGDIDYVECGGNHTFVVTKTGVIFVTGDNSRG